MRSVRRIQVIKSGDNSLEQLSGDYRMKCLENNEVKRRRIDCVMYAPSRAILHIKIQMSAEMKEVIGAPQISLFKVPAGFIVQEVHFSNTHLAVLAHNMLNSNLLLLEELLIFKMDVKREHNFPYFTLNRVELNLPPFEPGSPPLVYMLLDDSNLLVLNDLSSSSLYSIFKLGEYSFQIDCISRKCIESVTVTYRTEPQLNPYDSLVTEFLDELIYHEPEKIEEKPKQKVSLTYFALFISPLIVLLVYSLYRETYKKDQPTIAYDESMMNLDTEDSIMFRRSTKLGDDDN